MAYPTSRKWEEERKLEMSDCAISIVLSDSNAMSCELLGAALRRVRSLRLLKCAITMADICESVVVTKPDVAIVSIHLSDSPYGGFRALRQIQASSPRTRCIMLMEHPERDLVIDAFRAGARGVFKRSAPLNHLYKCISAIHAGQVWASSQELHHLLEAVQTTMPLQCLDSAGKQILTSREQQIVPLVAAGLTNKEISDKLRLSEHTIKNHLFRIYDRLGISSRVELILYATTRGHEAGAHNAY